MTITETFLRDIAEHQMTVIRDDGAHRHLRFQKPGTRMMYFDIITWPGYLCYVGDMGTYVFQRLSDMLVFFRKPDNCDLYRFDARYWSEKVEATDKHGGVYEWSESLFREAVREHFDQFLDGRGWTQERRDELWEEIDHEVLGAASDGEHFAWAALHNFEYDGFQFVDWEDNCNEFTFRFLWCCHALRWAISVYDANTVKGAE